MGRRELQADSVHQERTTQRLSSTRTIPIVRDCKPDITRSSPRKALGKTALGNTSKWKAIAKSKPVSRPSRVYIV
jgi:hypothetical protein